MKRRKRGGRFGTLLFLVPTIVVLALVIFAVLYTVSFQNGTLIVNAQTSSKYYQPKFLNVSASVSGRLGTTPYNLSLAPGTYTVSFSQRAWFYTPAERVVSLPGGKTAYAVGVYDPIVRTVLMTGDSFNSSNVSAEHGITPVIFINQMKDSVLIQSIPTGRVNIPPAGNFTFVFPQAGRYSVYMTLAPSANVTISVA